MLGVAVIAALIIWLFARRRGRATAVPWRDSTFALLDDADSVGSSLQAGADPQGVVVDAQWASVMSHARGVREALTAAAPGAPDAEIRDSMVAVVNYLRALEVDADAARRAVAAAADAVPLDLDRLLSTSAYVRQLVDLRAAPTS